MKELWKWGVISINGRASGLVIGRSKVRLLNGALRVCLCHSRNNTSFLQSYVWQLLFLWNTIFYRTNTENSKFYNKVKRSTVIHHKLQEGCRGRTNDYGFKGIVKLGSLIKDKKMFDISPAEIQTEAMNVPWIISMYFVQCLKQVPLLTSKQTCLLNSLDNLFYLL